MSHIDVKIAKPGFWHLPKAFYGLMIIEFCERFAFYGLQSVAVLYFIQAFNVSDSHSSDLFSSFSALLYGLLTIGGAVGDKLLGLRRTYLLGIILLIIGYLLLSLANGYFMLYYALAVILVGNIFFKTNANNYVSRCFEANDPRLDSAFTYFYMSINMGSLISIVLVPIVAKTFGYHIGLSLCCIAMIVGLLWYLGFRERLTTLDNRVGRVGGSKTYIWFGLFFLSLAAAFIFSYVLNNLALSKILLYVIMAITLIVYLFISASLPKHEGRGMLTALVLLLEAVIFWVLYMQTATSMTLFAYHNINLSFWGYCVPAGVTQAFNPFFIFIFSPILANIYIFFARKGCDISIPYKFVFGIFITGACFLLLGFAANCFADANYKVSVGWLFAAYGLYSFGEMLVSALGPSMVAKLLPKRLGGFAQGIWYLTSALGMRLGGQISASTALQYSTNNSFQSLYVYMHLFYYVGIIVVVLAVLLSFMAKSLTVAMNSAMEHRY